MTDTSPRPLEWVGNSMDVLRTFPVDVRQEIGYALYLAQCDGKHLTAKPLKGFKGGSVLEIVTDFDGDTYRTVYTLRHSDVIYVLHAFQKKSKKGIATTKQDVELIQKRLKRATEHYLKNYKKP